MEEIKAMEKKESVSSISSIEEDKFKEDSHHLS